MDPYAMTTLLGDAIFNIEEEEYLEVYQHALNGPSEEGIEDEDEDNEEGEAHDDDNEDEDNEEGEAHNDDNRDEGDDDEDEDNEER